MAGFLFFGGGVRMIYDKKPLTFEEQADLLLSRNLVVNRDELIEKLSKVSYYRLSGYWFPFLRADYTFYPGTTFSTIWHRYTFDRQLRLLFLDAVERTEIVIRTEVVYRLSHLCGPFGYAKQINLPNLSESQHVRFIKTILAEYRRSNETFIQHFAAKYGEDHDLPPVWMVTELISFGTMLTLFRGIPTGMKQQIASDFGIPDRVLESWLTALNALRNVCAHHGRLWNRQFGYKPMIPRKRKHPEFHVPAVVEGNQAFGMLTILRYLLARIAPQSHWPDRLEALLTAYPDIPLAQMGFPENWKDCPIWQT
jgi:abortive infection bacteriophage resistance protein